ncbi:Protein nedd1 [Mortierella claussenii]|nr:Protein nedd1 [Mortierella claussenii]
MDPAPPTRPITQRKRSYSTTAYSSQEEETALSSHGQVNNTQANSSSSSSTKHTQAPAASCLLAAAAGNQMLTYEFINTGAVHSIATSKSGQPPIAVPGQYEGIQKSNERIGCAVSSLQWSPDNSMLAVETQDGRIHVYDSKGRFQEALVNESVAELSRSGPYRCAMSWVPKSQRLYFAKGRTVMTWDAASRRTTGSFETGSRINALAINSEDILLAVGQNTGSIDAINRETGISATLETPTSWIVSKLEYSAFKKSILGGVGNDGILRLWDTGTNGSAAILHSFTTTHEKSISGMSFSPSNQYLICTAGLDRHYALYDVESKKVVRNTLTDYSLTSATFKNDGISLAFGTDQGKVLLYDLRSCRRPISIVDTRINAPVTAVHFQGKLSSTMKRHQTLGLRKQNYSATASTSTSVPASLSTTVAAAASAGVKKSVLDMFSVKQAPETAAGPASAPPQENVPSKSKSPAALVYISTSTSSSTLLGGSGTGTTTPGTTSKPVTPSTAGPTFSGSFVGMTSTPTTPTKEHPQHPDVHSNYHNNQSGSYPNSRTVSPFAFQVMQSHSPSAESSTSSSSVNSPPGSPSAGSGMRSRTSAATASTQPHLRHHHYQYPSVDSISAPKSPSSISSRAKRRKSFGTLLASGGASSALGAPNSALSDEKIEIWKGQIVDRVKNVLLDHAPHPPAVSSSPMTRSRDHDGSTGALPTTLDEVRTWQKPVSLATASKKTPQSLSTKSKVAPTAVKDLWMQVGVEDGSKHNNAQAPLSTLSKLAESSSSLLGPSALSTTSTSPFVVPGSNTSARAGPMDPDTTLLSAMSGSPLTSATFPSKILEGVIEGCLMEFRAGIRNDIQNMHLELLRQFQIQKMQIEELLKEYTDTRELREENERLQEENRRLRMNY